VAEVRRRAGAVQVTLSGEEASALTALAAQVATLLSDDTDPNADGAADPLEAMVGMTTEAVPAPDDPALRRLLPDAYGDEAAAGEFRRLMDGELRRLKSQALDELRSAVEGGGEAGGEAGVKLRLTAQQAEKWLQALTDIRLVLGTRLDVTEDLDDRWAQLGAEDVMAPLLAAYEWLGWLQESVVAALDD
jgi:hypothetical protein